ncbi:MAG: hypothetical protein ACRCWY_07525 [Cellulosilyticaceae bacterium]
MQTIALDLSKRVGDWINAQDNVVFEDVLVKKGNVNYNNITGVITFNRAGRYMISWDVITQGTAGTPQIGFAIRASNGQEILTETPSKNGEIVGFGMIQVDVAPVEVRLVNTTSTTVYYSTEVKVKAHLSVGELLENTSGSKPVIWESAGLQLINRHPTPMEYTVICPNKAIPFDNMTVQFNGVNYHCDTLKIIETGMYLVSWQITAKAMDGRTSPIVYLEDEQGIIYGKSGMDGNTLAPLSGTTLLQVMSIPLNGAKEFYFVNRTDCSLVIESIYNECSTMPTYFAGCLTVVKVGDIYYT